VSGAVSIFLRAEILLIKKPPKGIDNPGGFHSGTFWMSLVMAFSREVMD
jgi:hypothetical protein